MESMTGWELFQYRLRAYPPATWPLLAEAWLSLLVSDLGLRLGRQGGLRAGSRSSGAQPPSPQELERARHLDRLVRAAARVAKEPMPPEGKGVPLTAAEVGLLRAWIDQGAK